MILIGEKINATLPYVRSMIQNRDGGAISGLAKRQADAGIGFIDVNVGTGVGSRQEEVRSMEWAVGAIQSRVDIPLSIDSSDPAVLEAGLKRGNGRPSMINSTKAERESLEEIVPLASAYNSPLVALAMDESGIPETVQDRLHACEKIAEACERWGVPMEHVFFDPLVMPIGTDITHGLVTLETVTEIKKEFPDANTVLGISNISYGLPARNRLNAAFLHMAIYAGLDAAIVDPLNDDIMGEVRTAEVLVGKDRHCRRYTRAFRDRG
ncbi:MAG: dihydropteroate synthase [Deltaproteobacteria bacterium]|nr:MAG: dihydropteroate synthase [Deltaproteobacteria bacterium]